MNFLKLVQLRCRQRVILGKHLHLFRGLRQTRLNSRPWSTLALDFCALSSVRQVALVFRRCQASTSLVARGSTSAVKRGLLLFVAEFEADLTAATFLHLVDLLVDGGAPRLRRMQ